MLLLTAPAFADLVLFFPETYEGDDLASEFETELTKDADGNYVIADFFNSGVPLKFVFDQPEVGKSSNITFTSPLDREGVDYPYMLDADGNYVTCIAYDYNGTEGETPIYWTYLADGTYSYVYRYDMTDEENYYEYYGRIVMSGFLDYNGDTEADWIYISFWFNEPESGVKGITDATESPVVYYNLNGQRVNNPANGIFVRKQGSDVKKVVIR